MHSSVLELLRLEKQTDRQTDKHDFSLCVYFLQPAHRTYNNHTLQHFYEYICRVFIISLHCHLAVMKSERCVLHTNQGKVPRSSVLLQDISYRTSWLPDVIFLLHLSIHLKCKQNNEV